MQQPSDNSITSFLEKVSVKFPQIFYKPLFACATATKETTITQHLRVLLTLAHYVHDFWTRDAEMAAIALAGDIGGAKPTKNTTSNEQPKLRLGQLVLFVQILTHLRSARLDKAKISDSVRSLPPSFLRVLLTLP
jgi:hypothetical protein